MIIAIDGAVKAPGTPNCLSVGCAAFFEADGDELYTVKHEYPNSTSQRGEINGLILALQKMVEVEEEAVILTDSEYLYNTVMFEWVQKWAAANWIAGNGEPPKNQDLWKKVLNLLNVLEAKNIEVTLVWTKGHLFRYPAGKIKTALSLDPTGSTLLTNIATMMSVATARKSAVQNFNEARRIHDYSDLPADIAADYIMYNTFVDAVATYTATTLKSIADSKSDNK